MRRDFVKMCAIALVLFSGTGIAFAQSGSMDRVPGVLSGTVENESGATLSGIKVQIFEEGLVLAETETGADGRYYLEFDYIPDIDWTLLTWFIPQDNSLLPDIVILRESLRSKELVLWSPCLQRVELKSRISLDSVLYTEKNTLAKMSELECLENN